jgi:hypothetical protein
MFMVRGMLCGYRATLLSDHSWQLAERGQKLSARERTYRASDR